MRISFLRHRGRLALMTVAPSMAEVVEQPCFDVKDVSKGVSAPSRKSWERTQFHSRELNCA